MENALIYAFKESKWFSCTKIVGNLMKCYEQLFDQKNLLRVNYNFEEEYFDVNAAVDLILEHLPERLIFVDHRPNPRLLLNSIFFKAPKDYNPEIVFHVYGDFTISWVEWSSMEKNLIGKSVKFLCSSDAQVDLIKKFVDVKTSVMKVPFPVDFNEFNLEKSSKVKMKERLNINEEDKVLIYTGRFSLQKNIVELVEIFLEGLANGDISLDTHLVLAGTFDNIAFMFGDIYFHEGELFRIFDRMYSKYSDKFKKNVHFVGNVNNKELKNYYLESDYFISFSTYHDEDYGMSVAEAGACGCKMILTDWAGYKSFNLDESTKMIPTYLDKEGPHFDKKSAKEVLKTISKNERRELISESFKAKGIDNVLEDMKKVYNSGPELFDSFSHLFHKLSRRALNGKKIFFNEMNREMNSEYTELYESYSSKN